VSPSVKGVKLVKPPVVRGTRLPTTGAALPIGLLLLIGLGTVGIGIALVVAKPTVR
jgi:hypothetical protein